MSTVKKEAWAPINNLTLQFKELENEQTKNQSHWEERNNKD